MPGACPRRKIADFLGPDLHPARPNDDVFPSAWPSWLSFTPATTRLNGDRGARPPTFKGDSRKTSKKTQAPHTGGAVSHAERFRSRPGRGGRLLLCMRTTFSVGNRPGARCRRFAHLRRRHGNLLLLGDWNPRGLERVEQFAGPSEIARGRCQSFHERVFMSACLRRPAYGSSKANGSTCWIAAKSAALAVTTVARGTVPAFSWNLPGTSADEPRDRAGVGARVFISGRGRCQSFHKRAAGSSVSFIPLFGGWPVYCFSSIRSR
jgi:hypothetical protein